MFVVEN